MARGELLKESTISKTIYFALYYLFCIFVYFVFFVYFVYSYIIYLYIFCIQLRIHIQYAQLRIYIQYAPQAAQFPAGCRWWLGAPRLGDPSYNLRAPCPTQNIQIYDIRIYKIYKNTKYTNIQNKS